MFIQVDLYVDLGRFTTAAKHHREIAELYEGLENMESAGEHYQQAADFYEVSGGVIRFVGV